MAHLSLVGAELQLETTFLDSKFCSLYKHVNAQIPGTLKAAETQFESNNDLSDHSALKAFNEPGT